VLELDDELGELCVVAPTPDFVVGQGDEQGELWRLLAAVFFLEEM